jgi:hypothetical protein
VRRLRQLFAAVRTPLQVALITYAAAAGLAGVTVVIGIMVTPARDMVQEAIQPARELVESRPAALQSAFEPDEPRPPILPRPAGSTPTPSLMVEVQVAGPPVDEPLAAATNGETSPTDDADAGLVNAQSTIRPLPIVVLPPVAPPVLNAQPVVASQLEPPQALEIAPVPGGPSNSAPNAPLIVASTSTPVPARSQVSRPANQAPPATPLPTDVPPTAAPTSVPLATEQPTQPPTATSKATKTATPEPTQDKSKKTAAPTSKVSKTAVPTSPPASVKAAPPRPAPTAQPTDKPIKTAKPVPPTAEPEKKKAPTAAPTTQIRRGP